MTYTIHYIVDHKVTGPESWTGSLEDAKALGKSAVDSGAADRIELHNDTGLIHHHPRVTHAQGS